MSSSPPVRIKCSRICLRARRRRHTPPPSRTHSPHTLTITVFLTPTPLLPTILPLLLPQNRISNTQTPIHQPQRSPILHPPLTRQLRPELRIPQHLRPRRPGHVWSVLWGGGAFVGVVAAFEAFLALRLGICAGDGGAVGEEVVTGKGHVWGNSVVESGVVVVS